MTNPEAIFVSLQTYWLLYIGSAWRTLCLFTVLVNRSPRRLRSSRWHG